MNADEPAQSPGDREPRRRPTLLRLLEQGREERGSPPLWDAVVARLDEQDRRRNAVAPALRLLDQIHERVDDQTWQLVLDFERHACHEVLSGVGTGLELGYHHGKAAALLQAQQGPGGKAKGLAERFADLLGDTDAGYEEILMALVTTLQVAVMMGCGEHHPREVGEALARG
jgi:hypothetical protein